MRVEMSMEDLKYLITEFKDEVFTTDDLEFFINYTEDENTIEVIAL